MTGLYFNGRNAYVEVPDSESLNITDAITIEAWVKTDDWTQPDTEIVAKGYDYRILAFGNGFLVHSYDTDGDLTGVNSGDLTHLNGKWVHCVGQIRKYTGGWTARVYIDSVLKGEATNTDFDGARVTTSDITVGRLSTSYFNGTISSVRIYNRALSQSEIELLYSNPDYPLTDGLVLWLPMNEHSGNTVYDLSPYGNHGTIHNAVWAVRAVEHPLHAV